MIYVNKPEISEDDFVALLEGSRQRLESEFKTNGIAKSIGGVGFEDLVFAKMLEAAIGSEFEGHVEQTGAHAFPDIIARKLYGIEVKMTIGDKWISTGNSVLETTRIDDVQTIYMFFGKFGTGFEAKYRKYQDCLCEVGVTHSPRYKIDMNLAPGKSIFDKIGVDYDVFRKEENPIKRLKDYYRKQLKDGEELWWIDSVVDDNAVSPVIKSLKLLDEEVKDRFINEVYVLFPEIFGNSTVKFERPAAYLITEYNAVSSSLRDSFTAGGKMALNIGGKDVKVSRLLYNFYGRSAAIKKILVNITKEKLDYYWGVDSGNDPVETWMAMILKHSKNPDNNIEDVDIRAVFQEGSKND